MDDVVRKLLALIADGADLPIPEEWRDSRHIALMQDRLRAIRSVARVVSKMEGDQLVDVRLQAATEYLQEEIGRHPVNYPVFVPQETTEPTP
jgi:hypothetical protein